MIYYTHEKNNDNFRLSEAESFNECINDMCLIELPLLDRKYTWSNKRSNPTLERLDRVFINLCWDELLPNTILSSLTRSTSDHVPLKIEISTSVPRAKIFRFENYWIHSPGSSDVVSSAWACQPTSGNPSALIAAKLKKMRSAIRAWRKIFTHISQQETDCRIAINLLDYVEEHRCLRPAKADLRCILSSLLSRTTRAKLMIWKQQSKIRAAIGGDENTRYFHACANQQRCQNRIQVIEHEGRECTGHDQKAHILYLFYHSPWCVQEVTWSFTLDDLYPEGPLLLDHLGVPFTYTKI